jgi:phospholipase/carboxylesterase
MGEILDQTFSARLDCHYLLTEPETMDSRTPLVVALHDFGANPEAMLKLTRRLFDPAPVLVALQGPYQFFLRTDTRDVGYGWITNRRPSESIRLHRDMVQHVLEEVGGRYNIPSRRRLLVGFSQSVGLNYRFAAACGDAVSGVIAICGGLPGDWDENHEPLHAAVLHIARREDEYYPPKVTESYAARLSRRAAEVEFHLIDGGHQMPSDGQRIVRPWVGDCSCAPETHVPVAAKGNATDVRAIIQDTHSPNPASRRRRTSEECQGGDREETRSS